jgi:riboflavin kinase/FMN adenylyltransferase
MRVILDQGPGGARVLALGTFDGVHLGHQALLKAGKNYAREHGILLRVCSFDRHPLEVLRPEIAPAQLTTAAEKERLMASFGVDELQLLHFTREMADMPPEDFLKMLQESVDLKAVVAGWNYTFGKGGKGNADMLRQDGAKRGYDVIIVPPVKTETGEVVSSTLIRENLKQGHTAEAEKLMGHLPEINTAG